MHIVGLGLNHRTADAAFREQAAPMWETAAADTGVALCTCLRLETYLVTDDPARCAAAVAGSLAARAGLRPDEVQGRLAVRTGRDAVDHLFSVAAGLESMIVGERQILGQIRDAWGRAREAEPLDPRLDRLFQHAVATGKRVRRDTGLGRGARSVGDTAADVLARSTRGLGDAAVTIVGAGTVARATAISLGRRGARTFAVVNRSLDRGSRLAADLERRGWRGEAVPWERLPQSAAAADAIVCATSAPGYVLRPGDLAEGRRRIVVDLALPRDVDPAVGAARGVTLVDLDAVWSHANGSATSTPVDLADARAIVTGRVDAYMRWMAEREAVPAIEDLIRRTRRPGATPESRRALHDRTMALKRRAREPLGRGLALDTGHR
jgi:glutamyl-tRNA reductase